MIGLAIFVSVLVGTAMVILINRRDYNKKKYWINVCKNNKIPVKQIKWYDIFDCDDDTFNCNYFTRQMYDHNYKYDDIIKYLTKNDTFRKIAENRTYTQLYDIFYNYNFVGLNIDDVDKLIKITSISISDNTYIYNNNNSMYYDDDDIMCIKCYTNDKGVIEKVELLNEKIYI